MTNFVIDIEMALTMEELKNLKDLGDILGMSVAETARYCMNLKCKELRLEKLFEKINKPVDTKPKVEYNNTEEPLTTREKLACQD